MGNEEERLGRCPKPQQRTLFPAPFLRFAAVRINWSFIYRFAINEKWEIQEPQVLGRVWDGVPIVPLHRIFLLGIGACAVPNADGA